MARKINFWELPVEDAQPDDTVPAYRGRGQVARVRLAGGGGDAVTSVGVSMPAGFVVANSPITSSGTITVTFDAGYGLPTTEAMGQWSTAFSWGDHAQAGYALASDVTSALAGKVDTSDPRLTNSREWTASTVSQAEAEAGTATTRRAWTAQRVRQAIAAWWNSSTAKSKLDNIQAGATANQTDAYLLNRANHTGTQAASTITGLATVATTGSYSDLADKPSIPAGTVTSVGLSAPTGLSVSGSPVTGSGTLALAFASGYSLPTTAKQGQWDVAYGWGDHASAGYALASSLAAVATSGSYDDLSDKPSIPAAQVPADWNATSGVSRILNKPTLGTAAAADTGDFATAAQGSKADTAVQPGDLGTAASRNVPSSGNASSNQVVLGNDSRLTNARTPTAHTHAISDVTGLSAALNGKVDKVSGKGLSTEDYTSAEKSKLAGIEAGAEVNPATTAARNSASTSTVLQAKAMRDHVASGDHDSRYVQLTGDQTIDGLKTFGDSVAFANGAPSEGSRVIAYPLNSIGSNVPVLIKLARYDQGDRIVRGRLSGSRSVGSSATNTFIIDVAYGPRGSGPNGQLNMTVLSSYGGAGNAIKPVLFTEAGVEFIGISINVGTGHQYPTRWMFDGYLSEMRDLGAVALSAATSVTDFDVQSAPGSMIYSANLRAAGNLVVDGTISGNGSGLTQVDAATLGGASRSNLETQIAGKVDKVAGKGLSTEDYTTAEKNKLAGIEAGAQANTVTSVAGKTGAVTLVKADVGLANVDNTSDANKPISTAVATALSGKVDNSDPRLTNSREWTASTVTQAEAQAGTATTRRAWTALRVRQAILGWWSTVTLTKGDVGLGNVDNTSDADKPISTAVATALAGKVDNSDARLTNSREWTASTVSQAEAQAGTATTRRAWTAQRVRQAITGWWNSSTAKSKLDGIAAGATANQTDAYLLSRANHTGTQGMGTIDGLATALAGKVDTSDSRLTNSREWTASTVPQAEAQAGTATTRRAWTAQRVRQAIVAWWATITLTKSDVGLGNVDNTSDADKPISTAVATALSGKVDNSDARLTNSREWTASTVGQAEAEAGVATTRRAWTAQRVRQAIAAFTYDKPTILAMVSDDSNKNFSWVATTAALPANSANKVDFSSPRTLTLPGTPTENEYVIILRTAGSMLGSTIARNGQTIMGVAENMVIDSNISYLRLDFVDGSWRIAS